MIALFPYLESIFWQGGELFLLDYFEELFEKASSYRNINHIIATHGLLIDEKWALKLAKANLTLLFSIDSIEKSKYEYIRRGAKFEKLIKNIKRVNKYKKRYEKEIPDYKFETAINTVVMKTNCGYLDKFIEFAYEYNF
ncbi:MAG: radical SAM protein, partial [Gillisia sp.]